MLALAYAFVHGIARAIMVVQHTHGASHFALSINPSINRWVYRIATVLIGMWNPKVWDLQHVVAHHVYTNEWPYDTDSAFPIKSIAVNQRRFSYHKYQHYYMWIIYMFTIPLVCINSLKDTLIGRQVLYTMRWQIQGSFVEAWTVNILALIYLSIPYFFHSFWTASLIIMFNNAVSSLTFSLQFVVNHEVDKPGVMDGPPPEKMDWGQYQVVSSNTFSGDSIWKTWLAGGLNTQIEHHLFPGVWYRHYVPIRKIVMEVCKEFNIVYNDSPDLWDALSCHYRLLKNPPKTIPELMKKKQEKKQSSKAKAN